MGLVTIKNVEGNSLLGVWEMDDHIETIANSLSATPDILHLKTLKRKKEYVATRLLMDAMYAGMEISYHPTGKPYLINDDSYISISHSKNLVCILLNKSNRVGIDVQFLNPKIFKLKEKFLSAAEMSSLPEDNCIDALHVYWCAKEALYKLIGEENIIFNMQLHIEPFTINTQGKIKGSVFMNDVKSEVALRYEKANDYFLVYTTE